RRKIQMYRIQCLQSKRLTCRLPEFGDPARIDADVGPQANGAESLGQPTRHTRRVGWKEARGDAMLLAGRNQGVHGIQEHWMLELRRNAQRYSQIIVAHPRDVESRCSHDGVEILQGFWSLDDRNDNGLLV